MSRESVSLNCYKMQTRKKQLFFLIYRLSYVEVFKGVSVICFLVASLL